MITFSGNKDADRIILSKLDDRSLLNVCSLNKYTTNLCNENFFRNRTMTKFPRIIKPENISWKEFYLQCVYYIDLLHQAYNIDYNYILSHSKNPKDLNTPREIYKKYEYEDIRSVSENGRHIHFMKHPSEKVQLAAINETGHAIEDIIRKEIVPSEKVQLAAVSKDGDLIGDIIWKFIPSETVQLAAVKQNGFAIRYIVHYIVPSKEVQLAAVK